MKGSIHRYIAGLTTAVFILSGCGGPQNQMAPVGSMVPSAKYRTYIAKLPSNDLIYATGGCGGACLLSYPDGAQVGNISLSGLVEGTCSDDQGNVFITNDNVVLEFAHGGTTPIKTLNLPGYAATGCSVDPMTGNLAVVFTGSNANVAVFPSGTGSPMTYAAHTVAFACGYDNASNLFVSGYNNSGTNISELSNGQSSFQLLTIKGQLGNPGQIQWDGAQMAFESRTKGNIKILRLRITGTKAKVVGTTHLKSVKGQAFQSWIYNGAVLVPYGNHGQYAKDIGVWTYPGGAIQSRFKGFGLVSFHGVTVSVGAR